MDSDIKILMETKKQVKAVVSWVELENLFKLATIGSVGEMPIEDRQRVNCLFLAKLHNYLDREEYAEGIEQNAADGKEEMADSE